MLEHRLRDSPSGSRAPPPSLAGGTLQCSGKQKETGSVRSFRVELRAVMERGGVVEVGEKSRFGM